MPIPYEILTSAGVGVIILLAAIRQYFNGRSPKVPDGSVLTGIGVGLVERDQAERAVKALERIADAAERMGDQRQANMQHTLEEIAEQLRMAKT
ncbi:hypothetical protein [Oricola indica]|jgi:hypothetical protein|uniref:hypothetical protein n=1 Tax=Oricola indica TaxID=2872591 RepID=UPI001CBEBA30|nr:hypothetical protein [Oricola indica]